jgi:hypothetical protein
MDRVAAIYLCKLDHLPCVTEAWGSQHTSRLVLLLRISNGLWNQFTLQEIISTGEQAITGLQKLERSLLGHVTESAVVMEIIHLEILRDVCVLNLLWIWKSAFCWTADRMRGWTDRMTGGRIDGRIDGQRNWQTDGLTDRRMRSSLCLKG